MSPNAQRVLDQAKSMPDEFHGVDVTGLSAAERRELGLAGMSLSIDRKRRVVATYTSRLRADDLRKKVNASRKG